MKTKKAKPPVKAKRISFYISFSEKAVRGVHKLRLRNYIQVAVQQWSKGGDPDDILYDLDDKDFTITPIAGRGRKG